MAFTPAPAPAQASTKVIKGMTCTLLPNGRYSCPDGKEYAVDFKDQAREAYTANNPAPPRQAPTTVFKMPDQPKAVGADGNPVRADSQQTAPVTDKNEPRKLATPTESQQQRSAGQQYLNQFNQGIEKAKEYIKEGDLGRLKDERQAEINALLKQLQDQSQGMNSQEMLAAQELANARINAETQGKIQQLAAIQGSQGLAGGIAASQQMSLLNKALEDKMLAEKQLMLDNVALKNQGLAQYGNALFGAQGTDLDTQKYNLGQSNAEKFGQLSLGSNIASGIAGLQQSKENRDLSDKQNQILQSYLDKIGLENKGNSTTVDSNAVVKDKFGDPIQSIQKNGKAYNLLKDEELENAKYYTDKFEDSDGNIYVNYSSYEGEGEQPYDESQGTYGGGSDKGGKITGSTVICTATYESGGIPLRDLYITSIYSKKLWSKELHAGYLVWGQPIAKLVKNYALIRFIVTPFVRSVAQETGYRLGKLNYKSNFLGRVTLKCVELISKALIRK